MFWCIPCIFYENVILIFHLPFWISPRFFIYDHFRESEHPSGLVFKDVSDGEYESREEGSYKFQSQASSKMSFGDFLGQPASDLPYMEFLGQPASPGSAAGYESQASIGRSCMASVSLIGSPDGGHMGLIKSHDGGCMDLIGFPDGAHMSLIGSPDSSDRHGIHHKLESDPALKKIIPPVCRPGDFRMPTPKVSDC